MALSVEEMSVMAQRVGLNLCTTVYTTGEDWVQLFKQSSGECKPEVDFSGTKSNAVIFLLGYMAAWNSVSIESANLRKRILDALEMK